jgi:outer membrane translocation and assembly module TamA
VKKYVNGKLKEQKFVTREKLSKLVESATKKEHAHIIGGKATQKIHKNPKIVNVQLKSNTEQLLEEQRKKELEFAERRVVAEEKMVKEAETGNTWNKAFFGLIAIDVGMKVFDHL